MARGDRLQLGAAFGHNACMIYRPGGREGVAQVYGVPMHTALDDPSLQGERWAPGVALGYELAQAPAALDLLEAVLDSGIVLLDLRADIEAVLTKAKRR